jgi:hypothetical protein
MPAILNEKKLSRLVRFGFETVVAGASETVEELLRLPRREYSTRPGQSTESEWHPAG